VKWFAASEMRRYWHASWDLPPRLISVADIFLKVPVLKKYLCASYFSWTNIGSEYRQMRCGWIWPTLFFKSTNTCGKYWMQMSGSEEKVHFQFWIMCEGFMLEMGHGRTVGGEGADWGQGQSCWGKAECTGEVRTWATHLYVFVGHQWSTVSRFVWWSRLRPNKMHMMPK
jgi:hypothetical protein